MKTIDKTTSILYEIKNSKFYAFFYKVNNRMDCVQKLEDLKREYKDATHYCYAYIIDGISKCSDDGEPSGTAGLPILNVLKQKDLNHVLCVVIRYFGGIKLGAGGLVRAYSKATSLLFDEVNIIESKKGFKIRVEFSYEHLKQVDYILRDVQIVYKEYDENIIYEVLIEQDCFDSFKKEMESKVKTVSILEELYL